MSTTADSSEVRRYDRTDLLEFIGTCRPDDVTVTGFPGSGFILLTDVLGEACFVGKAWTARRTPVLVVLRQSLTPAQALFLADLGVEDPEKTVASLALGEALVVASS